MARVRTRSGKPGKYWNLIITISGREYAGIPSKVWPADNAPSASCTHIRRRRRRNTRKLAYIWCDFSTMQGSKFHLSVSPGQVDFLPDNKITNICCPSDNLDRGSVARQILVSNFNGI